MKLIDFSTIRNRCSHRFTRWYAWLSHFYGTVESVKEYSCEGVSRDVFWYDKPESKHAGHATPFNTILLNRGLLKDYPNELTEYVFLHEVGHTRVPTVLRIIFLPLFVFLTLMALVAPVAAIAVIVDVATATGSIGPIFLATIAGSIVVMLFVGLFVVLSWLDEGYAEFVAISHIGIESYRRCHNVYRPDSGRGPIHRLVYRLRYPPPGLVIRVIKRVES